MVEAAFTLTEVGPSVKEIHRARLWKKIVRLVRDAERGRTSPTGFRIGRTSPTDEKDGLCPQPGQDENIAVLEAVTQAFAASRVCAAVEE